MLIEVHEDSVIKLCKCRTNKHGRVFSNWNVEGLLREAICEFYDKYGDKEDAN